MSIDLTSLSPKQLGSLIATARKRQAQLTKRTPIAQVRSKLTKLATTDRQAAELVQLRYFAGLPLPEIAQILGISPRTADRLWSFARAWLHQELERSV